MKAPAAAEIFERVSITAYLDDCGQKRTKPERLKYAFGLIYSGERVWSFDYDPSLPERIRHHTNRPGGEHAPD